MLNQEELIFLKQHNFTTFYTVVNKKFKVCGFKCVHCLFIVKYEKNLARHLGHCRKFKKDEDK